MMSNKQKKPTWLSAEFWIETLGWRRDERIDSASNENMKVLTWAYVIEFFLMGIYQLVKANYIVAAPLLIVATAITMWFAWQHRIVSDDEYGQSQLGKQYDNIGKVFAVGAVFMFIGALIIIGELDLLWTLMILIPSVLVILKAGNQQMFERRTWVFIGIVSVFGGLFGFFLGIGVLSGPVAWGLLALLAVFFAAIFWLYYRQ